MADPLLTRLKPFDLKAFMIAQSNNGSMTLLQAITAMQTGHPYACPQCPDGNGGTNGYVIVPNFTFTIPCPTCKGMQKTDVPYFAVNGQYVALIITGSQNIQVPNTLQLSGSIAGGAWASANTAIATVSNTGLVTAVAAGTVNITYTYNDTPVSTPITVTAGG